MNSKTSKALLIIASFTLGPLALIVMGACFGDTKDFDHDPITDCSNVEPGHTQMCSYRVYTPSLSLCITKNEETDHDCVNQVQYECPYEYYVNGTCTSENKRCTGGTYVSNGTNYNITVMRRLIYCPPER